MKGITAITILGMNDVPPLHAMPVVGRFGMDFVRTLAYHG